MLIRSDPSSLDRFLRRLRPSHARSNVIFSVPTEKILRRIHTAASRDERRNSLFLSLKSALISATARYAET